MAIASYVFPDSNFGKFLSLICAQLLLTQTRPPSGIQQIRQDQKTRVKTRQVLHTRSYSFSQRTPLTYHSQTQRHRNPNMVEWVSKYRQEEGIFAMIAFNKIRSKRVHIVCTKIYFVLCYSGNTKVTVFLGGTLKSYPSDICDISSITRHVFPAVIMWSILWIWYAIVFDVLNCNNTSFRQQYYFKVIWFQFSPDAIQANCLRNQYILVSLWLLPHVSSQTPIFVHFVWLICAQFLLTQTRPSSGIQQIRQGFRQDKFFTPDHIPSPKEHR